MVKNKVPTVEEFYEKNWTMSQPKMAIEFAKLHVKAALEAAADNSCKMSSTRDTIMNSYDLDNIK